MVGATALVWLAMGDISEPGGYMSMFRPPPVARPVEVVAAAIIAIALGVQFARIRRRRMRPLTVMSVSAGLMGMFIGFTLRVLSSLTDGANIGGGLLILVSPLVFIPLLVSTIVCWLRIARR